MRGRDVFLRQSCHFYAVCAVCESGLPRSSPPMSRSSQSKSLKAHDPQRAKTVRLRPRRKRGDDPRQRAAVRRQGDRAARRGDRPRQPLSAGLMAENGGARPARDHRARGIRRAWGSAISSIAWRWRRCRAPRARSASPTARIPTSASTRSCATARRRRRRATCRSSSPASMSAASPCPSRTPARTSSP